MMDASENLDSLLRNLVQNWDNPSSICFNADSDEFFSGSQSIPNAPTLLDPLRPKDGVGVSEEQSGTDECGCYFENWDANLVLNNLSVLEQKIHQLQDVIRSIASRKGDTPNMTRSVDEQPLMADLNSIITEVILTADTLLLSSKSLVSGDSSSFEQLENPLGNSNILLQINAAQKNESLFTVKSDCLDSIDENETCVMDQNFADVMEFLSSGDDDELKGSDNASPVERLPFDSYQILQLERDEILAPHAHFCSICGKGFKRDANLRMHMRGHGDEYKTVAALSKPNKNSMPIIVRRYSCPFLGCKRNKEHKNFQPLKTILCVKNHYKRSHCDKSYTCSRCKSKKFSVIADLKTHEKHCGRDKWLCSCGTTFSRKDKLIGHVALFQGHYSVVPVVDEVKCSMASQHRSLDEVNTCNNGSMESCFEIQ